MGILSSLLGGLAQATHSVAKGVDEAAEISQAPGFLRTATSAFAELTSRISSNFEPDSAAATIAAPAGQGEGGIFSRIVSGLQEGLGFGGGAEAPAAEISPPKLGGNALKRQMLETQAIVTPTAHDFNPGAHEFSHGLNAMGAGQSRGVGGMMGGL